MNIKSKLLNMTIKNPVIFTIYMNASIPRKL